MAKKTVTKYIAVDEDLWDEFVKFYPAQGGLSWFVNACIEKMIDLHKTPIDEEVEEIVNALYEEDKGE